MYGETKTFTLAFTRQANTTGYTAGQIVTSSVTGTAVDLILTSSQPLLHIGDQSAGSNGYITKVTMASDHPVATTFNVFFFTASPGMPIDASTLAFTFAQAKTLLGFVTLGTFVSGGTAVFAQSATSALNMLQYHVAPLADLYVVIESVGSFTPTSGQNFWLTVALEPARNR